MHVRAGIAKLDLNAEAAASADGTIDASKRIKNLKKKLSQIKQLKEKRDTQGKEFWLPCLVQPMWFQHNLVRRANTLNRRGAPGALVCEHYHHVEGI